MRKNFNPFCTKTPTADYGTFFNFAYYFVEKFGAHPNVYEFGGHVHAKSISLMDRAGAERIFLYEGERQSKGAVTRAPLEVCYRLGGALVYFFRRESVLRSLEYARDSMDEGEE